VTIQLKRIHDRPASSDGERILVDALWPRGVSREVAQIALWARSAAPSAALRRCFRELDAQGAEVAGLARRSKPGRVPLVFAAKEECYSNAVALEDSPERKC
jgi:uncharacterized protein YeaO (DUF488 family)